MDFIDNLFYAIYELIPMDSPEYSELKRREAEIMDQVHTAIGEELIEKLLEAQGEREVYEFRRYFLQGLRFGVELLRL